MNAKRNLGALLVAACSLSMLTEGSMAWAQKGKKPKEEEPAPPAAEPPMVKKAIALSLKGISWGQSPKQVADQIDSIIDEDYRPIYKETQPGVKMKAVDAQVAEDKAEFRRSRVDFGKLPTGYDNTPLRGEFSYNNGETLMTLTRKGENIHFFFIKDKLWKIIEERKLNATSKLGPAFPDAAVKLSEWYGNVPGRVLQPDANRFNLEVDWRDATTHLRAVKRSDTALGLAFEENATLANLGALRVNKVKVDDGIDPDVAAAMRKDGPPQGPPPGKDDGKKKR